MDERFRAFRTAQDVSMLKGLAFEEFLRQLFWDLGYVASKTKASGDYGADLILESDEGTTVVQAKQYAKGVGVGAVKDAVFARSYYSADFAMAVSTTTFTKQARHAAERTGVKLVDGAALERYIEVASMPREAAEPDAGDAWRPATDQAPDPWARLSLAEKGKHITPWDSDFSIWEFDCRLPTGRTMSAAKVAERYKDHKVEKEINEHIRYVTQELHDKYLGFTVGDMLCDRVLAFPDGVQVVYEHFLLKKSLPEPRQDSWRSPITDELKKRMRSECHWRLCKEVRLPDSVVCIGPYAFAESSVRSISLPDSLEAIDEGAFEETRLQRIELPSGLKAIGPWAFSRALRPWFGEPRQECLRIPGGVEIIRERAFAYAEVDRIVMDEGIRYIEEGAFRYSKSLRSVRIPQSVVEIGPYAFGGCESLADISLPQGPVVACQDSFDGVPNEGELLEAIVRNGGHVLYSSPPEHMGYVEGYHDGRLEEGLYLVGKNCPPGRYHFERTHRFGSFSCSPSQPVEGAGGADLVADYGSTIFLSGATAERVSWL